MPWMPPELATFFKYWSLTFAVFFIYIFSVLVAGMDIWDGLMAKVRKRRGEMPALAPLDPNPLKQKTVAQTLGMGPGQMPDEKRRWVLERARAVADGLGLAGLRVLVLEDSKEHPLVHFHDGKQLRTYRVDKTWLQEARAGNTAREEQIKDLLGRYLAADFLGRKDARPKRTTELAREAATKTQSAQSAPSSQAAQAKEPEQA